MMILHKALFVCILIMVFLKGATDAGCQDLLNQLMARTYLGMTIDELVNVDIRG